MDVALPIHHIKMNEIKSKKEILRASSIIGGASVVTILIGLIKVKVLAIVLGPDGMGLMGLLLSLLGFGSTIFGLGLSTIGVREIAINYDNSGQVDHVRKSLFLLSLILGLLSIFVVFIFRQDISLWLFNNTQYQWSVFLIGFAIFFTLIGNSQRAVLQGFRKINDQAKIKVFGAIFSTIIGICSVLILGLDGVVAFVMIVPVTTCLLGFFYTRKLPKIRTIRISANNLFPQWKKMISLGFIFMLSGLLGEISKLLVRDLINQELNLQAVGFFQSAWSISMTYIGFVLGAMAADYYPRLTQVISKKLESNKLVNDQIEIALVFSCPILLGMLTFSPMVIQLLYSAEFLPASEILKWQILGDVLKILVWALGFVVLSHGKAKAFFLLEFLWNITYIILIYFGIDYFGIYITGYAFFASYMISLIVTYVYVRYLNSFRFTTKNLTILFKTLSFSLIILISSYINENVTYGVGTLVCLLSLFSSIKTLNDLDISNKKIIRILSLFEKIKILTRKC